MHTLRCQHYAGGKLSQVAGIQGYSNHAIGSPVQDLTEIVKLTDGRTALAIPTPGYDEVAFMVFEHGQFAEAARIPASGRSVSAIHRNKNTGKLEFATYPKKFQTMAVP